jgi:SAM-dependent methyltransferase
MKTSEERYTKLLRATYLPGRSWYLRCLIYPRILSRLIEGPIIDMGCGFGDFLKYLSIKGRYAMGLDSNLQHVEICKKLGLIAKLGDILNFQSDIKFNNVILDNVLEHLDLNEIEFFYSNIRNIVCKGGRLIIIVPCLKGQERDPTHKTYITKDIVESLCKRHHINLIETVNIPTPFFFIGNYLYLQMRMFVMDVN